MAPEIFKNVIWAICVSIGFALLFNTPRRALWAVALLGAAGFTVRLAFLQISPGNIILGSMIGAATVGILGMYFAHRVHTPPIVFTVPAITNMIPGTQGYRFIIGILQLVGNQSTMEDFPLFMEVLTDGLRAGFIMLALATGIIFPILVFKTHSVKDKDLHRFINRKIVRRMKLARYKTKKKFRQKAH